MSVAGNLIERMINLNEMAVLLDKRDGFGIEIKIFSEDHPPAHMHVFDVRTGELLFKLLIPTSQPKVLDEIIPYSGDIFNKQKKIILNSLNYIDRDTGIPKWKSAILLWNSLHPNFKISIQNT